MAASPATTSTVVPANVGAGRVLPITVMGNVITAVLTNLTFVPRLPSVTVKVIDAGPE